MTQPESRVLALIKAANPTWLARTLVWAAGTISLGWFYLSALIPIEWPLRWLLVFVVPVAVSVGMSKWAHEPFPLGKWFLVALISLVSVFDFTALVIAVGTGVVVWPAAKAVASTTTGRLVVTAADKAGKRRTKREQRAGSPRDTKRKAKP